MLSNKCWRAAVFRIRITDSVFSRRGRKKSKLRPLLVAADPLVVVDVVPPPLVTWSWVTSLCCGGVLPTSVVGMSLPNSLPRTTNSVSTGSPFTVLLRWKMALDRWGCDIGATGFRSLPKIAECRLDSGKKSEFSRRKPRTKLRDSFESLSCRLWFSCCCWSPLAVLSWQIFLFTICAWVGALLARKLFINDWFAFELFAKMSLFTRSSNRSLWLNVLSFSIVLGSFISIALWRPDWSIDGSTEFRLPLAGKNRSKSQSRKSTASSLSEVVVEEVAAELTVAIDVDEEVVDSGAKCGVAWSTRCFDRQSCRIKMIVCCMWERLRECLNCTQFVMRVFDSQSKAVACIRKWKVNRVNDCKCQCKCGVYVCVCSKYRFIIFRCK